MLGAGTMGAQIAAHFANAGVPALLLDLDEATARAGLERARKLRPDPFFAPDRAALVTVGGFDKDLGRIADADWVIEAIVEQLDAKRELLARVDAVRRPGAIVSSNTSGIPDSRPRRRAIGRLPPPLAGHAFLQPAAVSAAARGDTDARYGRRRRRRRPTVRRSAARQGRRHRQGHAQLHRQPCGAVRRAADDRGRSSRAATRSRRSMRSPDRRSAGRRARRSGRWTSRDWTCWRTCFAICTIGCRRRPARPSAVPATARADGRPGPDRRKGRRGVLQAREGAGRRVDDSRHRSGHARVPSQLRSRFPRSTRRSRSRTLVSGHARSSRGRIASASSSGRRLRRRWSIPRRSRRDVAHSIDDVDWALKWGFGWELGPFETIDAIGMRRVVDAAGQVGWRPRGRRCRHSWTSR